MLVHLSTLKYKKSSILGGLSFDDLPPECRADGSLCGAIGTTNGACRIRRDRGCLLLRLGRVKLVAADDAAVIA
jgi:hypothetical protein